MQFVKLEEYAIWFVVVGLVLALLGYLWLVVTGFRVKWYWGLGLFPPHVMVTVWIFLARHFRRAWLPCLVFLGGLALAGTPYAVNHYLGGRVDLGPLLRQVDGEKHLTLTGWDRHDYSILAECHDVAVLQMANPDVTDATLANLKGMDRLRDLDLNGTKITDAGLAELAALPALATLRIKDTAVTDAGFQKHLQGLPQLMEVDARGTEIKSATLRRWKNEKPDRKYLR